MGEKWREVDEIRRKRRNKRARVRGKNRSSVIKKVS